jgi:hypothetical protein
VKKHKRRATVTWGLVILGLLTAAAACGGPNWQNQYTEEPVLTGVAETPDGSTSDEDSSTPPTCPGAPTCRSALSASPTSSAPPSPGNPGGNPDPVPWSPYPMEIRLK